MMSSCGNPGGVEGSVPPSQAAEIYGACGEDGPGEGPGAVENLAVAERWLEVRSVTEEMRQFETNEAFENVLEGATQVLELHVSDPKEGSTDQAEATRVESVAIHTSYIAGIDSTLDGGGRVFLALASKGLIREMVAFTLVRPLKSGSYFAGLCQYESLTRPLQTLLGDRYEDALTSIIGVTDRDAIIQTLSGELPEPTKQPTIFNPNDTDPLLLARVSVVVDIPRD